MSVGSPDQPPRTDSLAEDRLLLATASRQSPIAVVFMAIKFVRNLGAVQIGLAVVFLVSGRVPGALLAFGAAACVVGFVAMALAWWRFTFEIQGDELLVSKGVVAQERLTIPLDRVQSVSIDQGFLHRFVGLVSASVDTAGSSAAEFEIDAIDRPRAEALQRMVAGHRRTSPADATEAEADALSGRTAAPTIPDREIVRRTLGDLVKIGVSGWPWAGLVALAPLFAVVDDLGEFLPWDGFNGEEIVEDALPSDFGVRLVAVIALLALLVIVLVTLLGAVLQVVREVVSNWNLTLTRTATGLRRTAGLFSTTSKASTINRIQGVQTDRTPVERLLGIARMTLPTIGEGDLVVPGSTEAEIQQVREIVFDRAGSAPALDRKISPLSIFLAVRNRALAAVFFAVILYFTVGWWSLLTLLAVPLEWLIARRRWRLRRWSISPWRIAESYELVNSHTAELELIKAQTVSVSRSFFERRRGLATVRVETAEGHLAVPLITLQEATAVRDRVLHAAESDRRSWM